MAWCLIWLSQGQTASGVDSKAAEADPALQVNPLMRADIDLWTSIDGGAGMANWCVTRPQEDCPSIYIRCMIGKPMQLLIHVLGTQVACNRIRCKAMLSTGASTHH